MFLCVILVKSSLEEEVRRDHKARERGQNEALCFLVLTVMMVTGDKRPGGRRYGVLCVACSPDLQI